MHNLYFVTFRKRCRGPVCLAYYAAIYLNGQAIRLKPKLIYQCGYCDAVGDLFMLPVQYNVQRLTL